MNHIISDNAFVRDIRYKKKSMCLSIPLGTGFSPTFIYCRYRLVAEKYSMLRAIPSSTTLISTGRWANDPLWLYKFYPV